MQLHLSCGALGIQANQRQAIDLASKHGFDAVDADGKYLQGISDGELQRSSIRVHVRWLVEPGDEPLRPLHCQIEVAASARPR